MMPSFVEEPFHIELFEMLDKVERGELKNLIVCLPPRSGKSMIISQYFPAYILGKYPEKNMVCASYGSDLANTLGRKAKQIVMEQRFNNVFPRFKLSDEKKEGGNWETNKDGGYYSVGVGGALTGRGFDIGICDDALRNREDAESEIKRESIWNWYTSTFATRKQGSHAVTIIMMTRWHIDDLVGRLEELEKERWEILKFPAINKEGKALSNRPGFGLEFYEDQRKLSMRDFEALYQQDPIKSMGETFKKEHFRYFAISDFEILQGNDKPQLNKDDFICLVFVDPAFSTREGSDDTAIGLLGVDMSNNEKKVYTLDIFGGTILPSDAHNLAISMAEKWSKAGFTVAGISVEVNNLNKDQQAFILELERRLKQDGKYYKLIPYKPTGKKEDRIKYTLQPRLEMHSLFFRSDDGGNDSWRRLEEQLLKFPDSKKDDLIDMVCQGVTHFNNMHTKVNRKPARKAEVRNPLTGAIMN